LKLKCEELLSNSFSSISSCAASQRYGQAGRFPASSIGRFTNVTFCDKLGITMEDYDAEAAACVREHADMSHPGSEAGARGGGGAGEAGAGADETDE